MGQVAAASRGAAVVVGFVDADQALYNAAAVAVDGELVGVYRKMRLPNYGVFDELRYFEPGSECPVYLINGTAVGVNVCEDIWSADGPTAAQRTAGAEVIVNINGSPYHAGKRAAREEVLAARASDNGLFVAYLNLVGGQDELVFDGGSMIFDPAGSMIARAGQFREEMMVADLDVDAASPTGGGAAAAGLVPVSEYSHDSSRRPMPPTVAEAYDDVGEVYAALVMGTADYVRKCGFDKVLVAVSGGIDSSLVAAVAVDALGAENVVGVSMPSRYSSESSVLDAREMAENTGMEMREIPIEGPFSAYLDSLEADFGGAEPGLAEENVQSRIRGTLIMALSNRYGWLVLTTGNKSEVATGYATLYGDMSGGFAVIKDVPKTLVYRLAEYRNGLDSKPVIPRSVLDKPPSAELRPNQRDQDSLPPYEVLDPILAAYVEEDRAFDEIVGMGFEPETVRLVIGLVDRSEYKRRQAPPGVKITPRSFGRDRRMPIANRYRQR